MNFFLNLWACYPIEDLLKYRTFINKQNNNSAVPLKHYILSPYEGEDFTTKW